MLVRTDPFRELDRIAELAAGTATRAPRAIPTDVVRDGDRFVVRLDLPGVDPAAVDLTVEKDVLAVKAERSWRTEEGQEVAIAERPQGRFARQLLLGEGVDAERIEASYGNGVLTVTIPLAEPAKARHVEISGGGAKTAKAGGKARATRAGARTA